MWKTKKTQIIQRLYFQLMKENEHFPISKFPFSVMHSSIYCLASQIIAKCDHVFSDTSSTTTITVRVDRCLFKLAAKEKLTRFGCPMDFGSKKPRELVQFVSYWSTGITERVIRLSKWKFFYRITQLNAKNNE